jgi:CubicO group peptidase (beta-lactamase class C family)
VAFVLSDELTAFNVGSVTKPMTADLAGAGG